MHISTLGEACNAFCDIRNPRDRSREPFQKWLNSYRHDGIFDLKLYVTQHDEGYWSTGSAQTVNWIPEDGMYFGYPSDRPGGAQNYRYAVPADTYLPSK